MADRATGNESGEVGEEMTFKSKASSRHFPFERAILPSIGGEWAAYLGNVG